MNAPTTGAAAAAPRAGAPRMERMERLLGAPHDSANPLGFPAIAAAGPGSPAEGWEAVLDPAERVALFVPPDLGGEFCGVAELIARLRPVYRRDPATGRAFAGPALARAPLLWDEAAPRESRLQAARELRSERPTPQEPPRTGLGHPAGLVRAGMAVAAMDTALRLTLDFARDRRLYHGTVTDLPHARAALADAFARLLRADALVAAAARARPEGTAAPTACADAAALTDAAQTAVSTALRPVVEDLGVVLGARSYLHEGRHAAFARIYAEVDALDPGHDPSVGRLLLRRLQTPHAQAPLGGALSAPADVPLWVGDPQADRAVRACAGLMARAAASARPVTEAASAGTAAEEREAFFTELADRFADSRSFTTERSPLLW